MNVSLDEVVALAFRNELVEDWRYVSGRIQLRVGIMAVTLTAEEARTFLQGLIQRHYLTTSAATMGASAGLSTRTLSDRGPKSVRQEPADNDLAEKRREEVRIPRELSSKISSGALGLDPAYPIVENIFGSAIQRRRQRLVADLENDIGQLLDQVKGLSEERLSKNKTFILTALRAMKIGLRTHHDEKLLALRNAVMNAALPDPPAESLQHVFLSLIDSFTVWHIRVLAFLQSPSDVIHRGHIEETLMASERRRSRLVYEITPAELIAASFSNLSSISGLVTKIQLDLDANGLAMLPQNGVYVEDTLDKMWREIEKKRTTDLGDQFLRFVRTPMGISL